MFLVVANQWSVQLLRLYCSLVYSPVVDKQRLAFYSGFFASYAIPAPSYAMPASLASTPTSISKPSVRKHSSSDNLFACHLHHHQVQQQDKVVSSGCPPLPSSPSRNAQSDIYICIGFIFLFGFITIAVFLHGSHLGEIEKTRRPENTNVGAVVITLRSKITATPALKGLGTVFRRGTRAMNELVVAHIAEGTQIQDFRLFLRTLHRSGVPAMADIVFLFARSPLPSSMLGAIHEENEYFESRLLSPATAYMVVEEVSNLTSKSHPPHVLSNASISPFNFNAYSMADTESEPQPIWGSHIANFLHANRTTHARRYRWGSMVGFDMTELNPDDNLQGFFDCPPLTLRRWACYQMLLGMVKHRFKHVLLTNVRGVMVLGDPFVMARRGGLYVSMEDRAWGTSDAAELGAMEELSNESHKLNVGRDRASASSKSGTRRQGRRRFRKAGGLYEHVYGKSMWSSLEEFEKRKKLFNSGVIVGGIQQVRGLANTMVTEIVKVALDRASRKAFPDNVLLSYLLHKSSSVLGKRVLDHLHVLDNGESFVHSLVGSQQRSLFLRRTRMAYAMVYGGHRSKRWAIAVRAIYQDICSSTVDATVYNDCTDAHIVSRIVSRKASITVYP